MAASACASVAEMMWTDDQHWLAAGSEKLTSAVLLYQRMNSSLSDTPTSTDDDGHLASQVGHVLDLIPVREQSSGLDHFDSSCSLVLDVERF